MEEVGRGREEEGGRNGAAVVEREKVEEDERLEIGVETHDVVVVVVVVVVGLGIRVSVVSEDMSSSSESRKRVTSPLGLFLPRLLDGAASGVLDSKLGRVREETEVIGEGVKVRAKQEVLWSLRHFWCMRMEHLPRGQGFLVELPERQPPHCPHGGAPTLPLVEPLEDLLGASLVAKDSRNEWYSSMLSLLEVARLLSMS